MSGAFLVVLIAWAIVATAWDARDANKQKILAEMRDYYSKQETLNLIYQMKHQTMILYLGYGFLIGVATLAFLKRS
jgi:hypothetical protein